MPDKKTEFSYDKPTPQEVIESLQEKKRIEAKYKQAVDSAKKCLASDDFAKYRKAYQEYKTFLLDYMKKLAEPDHIKYNAIIRTCLAKIDVLDMLIESVEIDNKKVSKKEKLKEDLI